MSWASRQDPLPPFTCLVWCLLGDLWAWAVTGGRLGGGCLQPVSILMGEVGEDPCGPRDHPPYLFTGKRATSGAGVKFPRSQREWFGGTERCLTLSSPSWRGVSWPSAWVIFTHRAFLEHLLYARLNGARTEARKDTSLPRGDSRSSGRDRVILTPGRRGCLADSGGHPISLRKFGQTGPQPSSKALGGTVLGVLELLPPLPVGSIPCLARCRDGLQTDRRGPPPLCGLKPEQVPEPQSLALHKMGMILGGVRKQETLLDRCLARCVPSPDTCRRCVPLSGLCFPLEGQASTSGLDLCGLWWE